MQDSPSSVENQDQAPLSGFLEEIAGLIGREMTLRLVWKFGGVRICIPARPDDSHNRLTQVIGAENVRRLWERFPPGYVIDLPKLQRAGDADRHARIVDMRSRLKMSISHIALEVGMTERGVYKALRRLNGPKAQRRPR